MPRFVQSPGRFFQTALGVDLGLSNENPIDIASSDGLTRSTSMTGVTDGLTGILSIWLKHNAANVGTINMLRFRQATVDAVQFEVTSGVQTIKVEMQSSAGSTRLLMLTSTTTFTTGVWRHFLASWDLNTGNNSTDDAHFYIDDVDDKNATVFLTGTNIQYSANTQDLFNATGPTGQWCTTQIYFAPNQYLDFSVTANRRKFIAADGSSVALGPDGSTPTGTAPAIYLQDPPATWDNNLGTGGDFTITGTPTACADGPP